MTTIKPDPDVIDHFEKLMSFGPVLFECFSFVISEDTGSTKLLLQRKTSRYPSPSSFLKKRKYAGDKDTDQLSLPLQKKVRSDISEKKAARKDKHETTIKCGLNNFVKHGIMRQALLRMSNRLTALLSISSIAFNQYITEKSDIFIKKSKPWSLEHPKLLFSSFLTAFEGRTGNSLFKNDKIFKRIACQYRTSASVILQKDSSLLITQTKMYAIQSYVNNLDLHIRRNVIARIKTSIKNIIKSTFLEENKKMPKKFKYKPYYDYFFSKETTTDDNDPIYVNLLALKKRLQISSHISLDDGAMVDMISDDQFKTLGYTDCFNLLRRLQLEFMNQEEDGQKRRTFTLAPINNIWKSNYVQIDASTGFLELAWNSLQCFIEENQKSGENAELLLELKTLLKNPSQFYRNKYPPERTHRVFEKLAELERIQIPSSPFINHHYKDKYDVEKLVWYFYNKKAVSFPKGHLFQGMMSTDGVGVSVILYKPKRYNKPKSANAKTIQNCEKRTYSKKIEQLDDGGCYDLIIGNDPGRKNVGTTWTIAQNDTLSGLAGFRSLPVSKYHEIIKSDKRAKIANAEFENRAPASVKQWKTDKTSLKCLEVEILKQNNSRFMENSKDFIEWACDLKCKKRRWFAHMNLQSGVCKSIKNLIPVKKKRKAKIAIAWGDAGFAVNGRGNMPGGSRKIKNELMKRYGKRSDIDIIFIDEYKTSKMCYACHSELKDPDVIPDDILQQSEEENDDHKKKKVISSYKYSNRFCQICDFVYDRDVNAAKNITGVLIWQFQNDRTTNKRPDYLRRMKRVAPIT